MKAIQGTAVRLSLLLVLTGLLGSAAADPMLAPDIWTNVGPTSVAWQYLGNGGNCFTQGMAIDHRNPSTIYLCVQDFVSPAVYGGLWKTTNAGSTWAKIGPMEQGENVRIDPANSQHLYCADIGTGSGTHTGFWVSNDGGATWAWPAGFTDVVQNSIHTSDVYHADVDPTDFNHVLVSFHSGWNGGRAGVIESKDGGATFLVHQPDSRMTGSGGTDVFFLYNPALGLGDNKTWLYGIQDGGGYWRTTDAGTSWTQVTTNSMQHGGAQIHYTKTGVLYCSGSPYILRSTNNGVSWATVGPYGAFIGLGSDGTNLWALQHNGGSFITSPETDGINWTTYGTKFFPAGGAFEFAFDSVNSILYGASTGSGLLAMRVNAPNTGIVVSNAVASPAAAMDNAVTTATFSIDVTAQSGVGTVTIDLRSIGGAAAVAMTKGAGNTYSTTFSVQSGAVVGDKVLLVKAGDNSGHAFYASIPFAVVDHTAPVLVSRNKTVVVSSVQNSTLPGTSAVDGDLSTRWGSAFADPQWIYIDLGAPVLINLVVLKWESYGKSYEIQLSNDASVWTRAYATTAGDGATDSISITPTTARYVRMYGTQRGTTYGYGVYEFAVYTPPSGTTVASAGRTVEGTSRAMLRASRDAIALTGLDISAPWTLELYSLGGTKLGTYSGRGNSTVSIADKACSSGFALAQLRVGTLRMVERVLKR